MSGEGLYPIAVLIDELKSEDLKRRLNSIQSLNTISIALGPERTRNELLPFIIDLVDDEDEALLALAESLGDFLDSVGGGHFATHLFTPLEKLAGVEEPTVRDKAVEAMKKIIRKIGVKALEKELMELIQRMMEIDIFTYKLSALNLLPLLYPKVSPSNQGQLMKIYFKASENEVPQVRRIATMNLKELIPNVGAELEGDLISIFNKTAQDDQDSVRLMSVENCIALSKHLPFEKLKIHFFSYIEAVAKDTSWRMRFMLADKIIELAQNLERKIVEDELATYFASFLEDSESEVRTAAAAKFAQFSELLSPDIIISKIIPPIAKLASDSFTYVRKALAENLLKLCPLLGGTNTSEHIIPIFLILLKDETNEVVLPLFKNIGQLNKVIGLDSLAQSIVPAISNLASDKKNWRSRLTMVEYFPILAEQTEEQFFNDKFMELCLDGLADSVFAIRETSIINLKKVTEIFGGKWAEKHVIPKILSYHTHVNYLFRQIPLFAIIKLAPMLSNEIINNSILPVLITLSSDKIPNIKFNVAKTFKELSPYINEPQLNLMKTTLKTFANDPDFDVRYFAENSLQSI